MLKVNGRPVPARVERGYAVLNRRWDQGDVIELCLPMSPRRVEAHAQVTADRGRVALVRGRWSTALLPDQQRTRVSELRIDYESSVVAEAIPHLHGGVVALKVGSLLAIPYYAWAHRGKSLFDAQWYENPRPTHLVRQCVERDWLPNLGQPRRYHMDAAHHPWCRFRPGRRGVGAPMTDAECKGCQRARGSTSSRARSRPLDSRIRRRPSE